MRLRSLFALLLALALPACDRAIAFEGLDGAPGPAGPQGVPGPAGAPGPRGEPAAKAGARLRPLTLQADDGSEAWGGMWLDSERGERCTFLELESEGWRCLPVHRAQQAIHWYATPTCEGARASQVSEPGYMRETSTGLFFQLGEPTGEAWIVTEEGCTSAGEGPWYVWAEVPLSAFVGADLSE